MYIDKIYFFLELAYLDNEVPSLLKRIRQSDESAFVILAKTYEGVIESAVKSFAPSFDIVKGNENEFCGLDDLRQYAMIALYRAANTYNEEDKGKKVSFGLYAKICINNALISALRKYRTEKKRRDAARTLARSEKTVSDPLGNVIDSEGRGEMLRQIANILSAYEKEVFEYYIIGKSAHEIAERLGTDEKSVSNAVYRIKVKIKGLLKN
ncbi:MAG: sigma-70 family RNA polymerase sigma factor [Ruminococcaceae bacterium]|nr:sigma-70 family RNA polymerase sigma factor [Oscillospiraceae bacterium]